MSVLALSPPGSSMNHTNCVDKLNWFFLGITCLSCLRLKMYTKCLHLKIHRGMCGSFSIGCLQWWQNDKNFKWRIYNRETVSHPSIKRDVIENGQLEQPFQW